MRASALLLAAACVRADADFFLSPAGDDSASGASPSAAWRTPGRAAQAIFFLRNGGPLLENVTVHLAAGFYFLAQPLTIAADSGGTGSFFVTWLGPPAGPPAVLSGGAPLPPLAALGGGLVSAVLPADVWPEGLVGQLFSLGLGAGAGGARRCLATTAVRQYASVVYGPRNATVALAPGSADAALSAAEMRAARVKLYHTWTSSVSPVLHWAPPFFNTSWTSSSDYGADQRYALQNVLNASLLAPGEFMFDPAARLLTYRLAPGETAAGVALVAPALREVLTTAPGAASVRFVNLTVAHGGAFSDEDCGVDGCSYQSCADGSLAAVHLHGATDVAFEGVEVAASGQSAVWKTAARALRCAAAGCTTWAAAACAWACPSAACCRPAPTSRAACSSRTAPSKTAATSARRARACSGRMRRAASCGTTRSQILPTRACSTTCTTLGCSG